MSVDVDYCKRCDKICHVTDAIFDTYFSRESDEGDGMLGYLKDGGSERDNIPEFIWEEMARDLVCPEWCPFVLEHLLIETK